MQNSLTTIHLEVAGRVQGVGFRWFVRQAARRLGIDGWAVNTMSGTVEIVAKGEPEALKQLEAAVAQGPSGAIVKSVTELAAVPEGEVQEGFDVR
ncbi:MAG: acylphosphatase [Gemmatimonadaceae bacterium]|nr:acylphosphatase [Gemmatimonadaceae bacterium]